MPHVYTEGDYVRTRTEIGSYQPGEVAVITSVHFSSQVFFDYSIRFARDGRELAVHEDEIEYLNQRLPNRFVARFWWALVHPILKARGWSL